MSLVAEQNAFLADVARLIAYAQSVGFQVTLGEGFRTVEQQAIYVKTGASEVSISQHQKRLAIDLNFFRNGTWITGPGAKATLAPLGRFWEELTPQNRWGGNFKHLVDTPHFERDEPKGES
jgi:hypothetical protein